MLNRLMQLCSLLACAWLVGCAAPPMAAEVGQLFDDTAFAPPTERVAADAAMAISPAMRRYLGDQITLRLRKQNGRDALIDALYNQSELQLRYSADMTRTAEQAFDARAGNCLSLVMMTAAFAREMGLPLRFQSVQVDEAWARDGNLLMFVGHVNIALGKQPSSRRMADLLHDWMTIDFLPGADLRHQIATPIDDERVVSMYLNNRAAEMLAQGRVDDAYWWARAAILQDRRFGNAHNTLGVVYLRKGLPARAEAALRRSLAEDADNPHTLINLAQALQGQGLHDQATLVSQQAQRLHAATPYGQYELGQQALRRGDDKQAQRYFEKALRLGGDHHEFHFALAQALVRLGEFRSAERELELAREHSESLKLQTLYAGKLQRLREQLVH